MKLIQSFSVDHNRIVPGIFTSRVDNLGDYSVTTYDIRLKKPNREPVIDVAAMHSLEHLVATYLRNNPDWQDEVIYWGPMGCLTGFYLILKGSRAPQELYGLMLGAFKSVLEATEVPGTAPENCGHYLMHDLEMAKWYAGEFAAYLEANAGNSDIFEYPRTERLVTEDGQHFYDS
jgi:S-ribosylhomocysteine lyase